MLPEKCVLCLHNNFLQSTFYSNPSLIQLQLIRMSDNQDLNMKNALHS
jgi:hypothetical protein